MENRHSLPLLNRSNPFSTRFTAPGLLPFIEIDSNEIVQEGEENRLPELLVDRFIACGMIGQVVGTHGSGKTTLINTLVPIFRRHDCNVIRETLHDRQRQLSRAFYQSFSQTSGPTLAIVDGAEQLSHTAWLRLRYFLWRKKSGLLITTHHPFRWLPVLFQTTTTPRLLARLVEKLLLDSSWSCSHAELNRLFRQHNGNIREILFALYDTYEEDCSFATGKKEYNHLTERESKDD